jgi:hypothetical protein
VCDYQLRRAGDGYAVTTCSLDPVGSVTSGCVHEHVLTLKFCAGHLEHMRDEWERHGTLLCTDCALGPDGHRCEARKIDEKAIA